LEQVATLLVYLTATQGDSSPSLKERIMFGKLE
jgi:hypothetical protein